MFCSIRVLTCLIHREEQRKSPFCLPLYGSTVCLLSCFCHPLKWCDVRREPTFPGKDQAWRTLTLLQIPLSIFLSPLRFSLEELHQPERCTMLWNVALHFLPVPVFKVSVLKMRWHRFILLQDAQRQGAQMCTDAWYSSFCSTWSVYLYVNVIVPDASFSV